MHARECAQLGREVAAGSNSSLAVWIFEQLGDPRRAAPRRWRGAKHDGVQHSTLIGDCFWAGSATQLPCHGPSDATTIAAGSADTLDVSTLRPARFKLELAAAAAAGAAFAAHRTGFCYPSAGESERPTTSRCEGRCEARDACAGDCRRCAIHIGSRASERASHAGWGRRRLGFATCAGAQPRTQRQG